MRDPPLARGVVEELEQGQEEEGVLPIGTVQLESEKGPDEPLRLLELQLRTPDPLVMMAPQQYVSTPLSLVS